MDMSTEAAFREGLGQGLLVLLTCAACGCVQTGVRVNCDQCGSSELHPQAAEPSGVVYARTTIFRAPSEAFRAIAPYTICLIDLEGGSRLMGHCPTDVEIGDRVTGRVATIAGTDLFLFEPSDSDMGIQQGRDEP